MKTLQEKFWSHVEKTDDCWLWHALRDHHGYGKFWMDGRSERAHRVAWTYTHGTIPKGMLVCHHCDNPSCVNPAHLFIGTNRDNILDCSRKGRMGIRPGSLLTHCLRGHPFNAMNTRWNPRGERDCRACQRLRQRKNWQGVSTNGR